jgi:hypothetical protein
MHARTSAQTMLDTAISPAEVLLYASTAARKGQCRSCSEHLPICPTHPTLSKRVLWLHAFPVFLSCNRSAKLRAADARARRGETPDGGFVWCVS